MKVVVCGGRNYTDLGAVWGQLDAFHALQGPITFVFHGGAKGADLLADKWAVMNRVPRVRFPADWEAHGRAAGPIRNAEMVKAKPDLVIAFPGGRGTANMVRQAREAGIEVIEPYRSRRQR